MRDFIIRKNRYVLTIVYAANVYACRLNFERVTFLIMAHEIQIFNSAALHCL